LDAERTAPDWDFMWNALIEEGREKKLKQMPLSRCPEPLPGSTRGEDDQILIAEAALKVLLFPFVIKFFGLLLRLGSDGNGNTL
jgi:oxalate---CoA ligase